MDWKQARKERKLTQQQVADDLDIDQSQLSRWEIANQNISIRSAVMLAKYYGVSLDEMYLREEN